MTSRAEVEELVLAAGIGVATQAFMRDDGTRGITLEVDDQDGETAIVALSLAHAARLGRMLDRAKVAALNLPKPKPAETSTSSVG